MHMHVAMCVCVCMHLWDITQFYYVVSLYSQLRLYAQHSGRAFALQDGFQASVVATDEQYNIKSHVVKFFFALSFIFPFCGVLCFLFFIKIHSEDIEKYMNDPRNRPTLSSLYWTCHTFPIGVIILDFLAVIEEAPTQLPTAELPNFQRGLLIFNLSIEFFFEICAKLALIFYKCHPLPHVNTITKKRVFLLGLISPLWSALSHLNYVVSGWISYEDRSIGILLMYLFVLVIQLFFNLFYYHASFYFREKSFIKSIHFIPVSFIYFLWLLILLAIVILLINFVQLASIDDSVTHIYTLGQYTFIFALFLITYSTKKSSGTSEGGPINKEVVKYWQYIYKNTSSNGQEDPLDIYSDKDRAHLLTAAFVFHLMNHDESNNDRYKEIMLKIMDSEEGRRVQPDGKRHEEHAVDDGECDKQRGNDVRSIF